MQFLVEKCKWFCSREQYDRKTAEKSFNPLVYAFKIRCHSSGSGRSASGVEEAHTKAIISYFCGAHTTTIRHHHHRAGAVHTHMSFRCGVFVCVEIISMMKYNLIAK